MQIKILRSQSNTHQSYTLPAGEIPLLSALMYIKETQDATLTFSAGCRASVCGTCAVRVNGREELACSYKVKPGDIIEPLQYHPVLRDLKVDKDKAKETLQKGVTWMQSFQETSLTHEDEKRTEKQTDCILCDSCYSACPVFAVNPDFLGPFALTRAYRYSEDKRESDAKTSLTVYRTTVYGTVHSVESALLSVPRGSTPRWTSPCSEALPSNSATPTRAFPRRVSVHRTLAVEDSASIRMRDFKRSYYLVEQ